MSEPKRMVLLARPLLIAATLIALGAAAFALIAVQTQTQTQTSRSPMSGPGTYLEETDIRPFVVVAIPCAMCILALVWDGKRHASSVLLACTVGIIAFVVVSAASVGLLFLPTAVLMLLALRRAS